jgi:hypothetical protein
MNMLINFAAFQIGWFSSVIGAAKQMPWLGPVAFVLVLALHLRAARRPGGEMMLVVACGTIGLLFESALVLAGWVTYPSGFFNELFAPYWIITMWMLFGTTLNLSMGWLKGRPLLAAGMGAIAGPASYLAGQKLGGIVFLEFVPAVVALAVGWAVFMPILMALAERFDGVSEQIAGQESRA